MGPDGEDDRSIGICAARRKDATPDNARQSHQFTFQVDQSPLKNTLLGLRRVLQSDPASYTPELDHGPDT